MIQNQEQLLPTAFARASNIATIAYMGSLMTFLAKGSKRSGCFALMVYHTKPRNEPPPHDHEREHELYFVLERAMHFYCEDKTLDIGAGDVVFLPQSKAMHSPAVLTRWHPDLCTGHWQGCCRHFVAMGEPAGSMTLPGSAGTYAIDGSEHAIRVGASSGIRILSLSETQRELPQ
jgi:hypothetical protein